MAKDSRKSSLGPDIGHCEELRDEASPYNNLSNLFTKYNIVGYIIPSTDEYQNEYSPLSSKRLEAATGFTGSNGYALITKKKGYLLTDSRYLIQARDELDEFFEVINLAEHNALSLRESKERKQSRMIKMYLRMIISATK
ncbi:MAG UNVERIFIED_CONTAM: aminopeptidase P family N-terminal domain-containing protein [Planctomycetaceae bacterium]|jgi:hypothetical protein